MEQDYVRTARAKGLSERRVVLKHTMKNASLAPVTVLGLQFAYTLGGTIVLENIFNLNGLGAYLYSGIQAKGHAGDLRASSLVIAIHLRRHQPVRRRAVRLPQPEGEARVSRPPDHGGFPGPEGEARDDPHLVELVASPEGFETGRGRVTRRFRSNRGAMTGLVMLIAIGIVADRVAVDRRPRLALEPRTPPAPRARTGSAPTRSGATSSARVLVGSRASLMVGVITVVLVRAGRAAARTGIGLPRGTLRRDLDADHGRACSPSRRSRSRLSSAACCSANTGASTNKSLVVCSVAISVTFIPGLVRILRSQVLAVREENYVEASRSIGVTDTRMVRKHVFPNVVSPDDRAARAHLWLRGHRRGRAELSRLRCAGADAELGHDAAKSVTTASSRNSSRSSSRARDHVHRARREPGRRRTA